MGKAAPVAFLHLPSPGRDRRPLSPVAPPDGSHTGRHAGDGGAPPLRDRQPTGLNGARATKLSIRGVVCTASRPSSPSPRVCNGPPAESS